MNLYKYAQFDNRWDLRKTNIISTFCAWLVYDRLRIISFFSYKIHTNKYKVATFAWRIQGMPKHRACFENNVISHCNIDKH